MVSTRTSFTRALGRAATIGAVAALIVGGFAGAAHASTTDYITEDDFGAERVAGLWADATGGGSFEVAEFSGADAMRLDLASTSSRVYLYETYPAESRPTDISALRAGASYTYAGTNVNFQIELIFSPTDPAYNAAGTTPCASANAWGFTDVPSTWCYTVIKWEPLAASPGWTTVDLTADTAVDSSATPKVGGWRTTKQTGKWAGTGGFSGSGTFAQYFAEIAEYQVVGTAFGTGSGTPGPVSGWVRDVTFGGKTTLFGTPPAVTTTTTLGASASTVTVGSAVTLTATVSPSTAVGQVSFSDGTTTVGTVALTGGTASLSVTPALGSTSYTASFVPADPAAFVASTATAIAITANPVPTPEPPVAPPATTTDDLLDVLDNAGVDVGATTQTFSIDGGTPGTGTTGLDAGVPFDATLPWESQDDFVDVYAYSSPVFIGTFPVVGGVVQLTGVDLSALESGGHHLVFIGQTSGDIAAVSITVAQAPAGPVKPLASTGLEIGFPLGLAAALLALGAVLTVRRRSRQA